MMPKKTTLYARWESQSDFCAGREPDIEEFYYSSEPVASCDPITIIISAAVAAVSMGVAYGISLLTAPGPTYGSRLLNRTFSTSTYGADIERCRGTVRVPGNLIWSTTIQESLYSLDTPKSAPPLRSFTYTASMALGFGRGPCQAILALWMDGKRVYSAKIGTVNRVGTVTLVASTSAPAYQGQDYITVHTGSASSLYIQAGTIIHWPGDDIDYEVQQDVTLGPDSTAQLFIWPPLQSTKTESQQLEVPGEQGDTLDMDVFTVDPNIGAFYGEGSRFPNERAGNRMQAPITFYLGTETQLPDPLMQEYIGAGNVPAYRGLVYAVIDQLALQSFGNRIPNITAEIAFDDTNNQFPYAGPVPDATAGRVIVPGQISSQGPQGGISPWVVAIEADQLTIDVINAQTMTVQNTFILPIQAWKAAVDTDGFLYVIGPLDLNQYALMKFDILTGLKVGHVGYGLGPDATDTPAPTPGFGGILSNFDGQVASMVLFDYMDHTTNTLKKYLAMTGGFGGTVLINRDTMPPAGNLTASGTNYNPAIEGFFT